VQYLRKRLRSSQNAIRENRKLFESMVVIGDPTDGWFEKIVTALISRYNSVPKAKGVLDVLFRRLNIRPMGNVLHCVLAK